MINFKKDADANGTSLQGYITISYDELVSVLGEPDALDGDKTLAEWSLSFDNGVIATIYDWKNYGGNKESITHWHIGGNDIRSVMVVNTLFQRQ